MSLHAAHSAAMLYQHAASHTEDKTTPTDQHKQTPRLWHCTEVIATHMKQPEMQLQHNQKTWQHLTRPKLECCNERGRHGVSHS
jgi:hypothetical protein